MKLLKLVSRMRRNAGRLSWAEEKLRDTDLTRLEEVRIDVVRYPVYYLRMLFYCMLLAFSVGMIYWCLTNDEMNYRALCIAFPFVLIWIYSTCFIVYCIKYRRCHLIINDKGISGVYNESSGWIVTGKLKEFSITWDQIKGAVIMEETAGKQYWDVLFLMPKKNSGAPLPYINLLLFPTDKVVEVVNAFYAKQQGATGALHPLIERDWMDRRVLHFVWVVAILGLVLYSLNIILHKFAYVNNL